MTIILKEKSERDDELSHKYHCDACEKDITFLVRFTCAVCRNISPATPANGAATPAAAGTTAAGSDQPTPASQIPQTPAVPPHSTVAGDEASDGSITAAVGDLRKEVGSGGISSRGLREGSASRDADSSLPTSAHFALVTNDAHPPRTNASATESITETGVPVGATDGMDVEAPPQTNQQDPPKGSALQPHLQPDLTATLASGNELDLCVDCFCSGVELKDHKRTHPFIIREALNYPLFEPTWTAQEELLMVDGMRTFGMGNWEQIADHVGSKDKYEVEAHYMRTYVESPTWPIPNMEADLPKSERLLVIRDMNPPTRKPERSATSGPANHEIQGFMPAREEFETEFDNDAETAVKDMVFEETDTPQEVLLKTTILNIYNTTLDRRLERKRFIKDRGLTHDFRKILAVEKKRTREEKELLHRTRVLARLQTAADYELLLDGLFREQKLRHRIAELQEYRRMGMTTFKDAADYERDKIQRMSLKASGIGSFSSHNRLSGRASQPFPPARSSSLASFSTRPNHSSELSMASTSPAPAGSIASFTHQSNGLPQPSSSFGNSFGTKSPNLPNGAPSSEVGGSGAGAAAGSTSTPTTPSLTSHHQAAHPPQPAAAAGAGPVGMTPLPNTYRRGTVQPLDISTAESVELLLPNEQQLCSNLRIQPKAYLNIKETLLKEFTTTGVLQRKRAREMIKIDVNKTAAIYDLFVVNGWINP